MDPAFVAIAQAIGAAYMNAHARNPHAFPVPHKDSAPVTQESVNALV